MILVTTIGSMVEDIFCWHVELSSGQFWGTMELSYGNLSGACDANLEWFLWGHEEKTQWTRAE